MDPVAQVTAMLVSFNSSNPDKNYSWEWSPRAPQAQKRGLVTVCLKCKLLKDLSVLHIVLLRVGNTCIVAYRADFWDLCGIGTLEDPQHMPQINVWTLLNSSVCFQGLPLRYCFLSAFFCSFSNTWKPSAGGKDAPGKVRAETACRFFFFFLWLGHWSAPCVRCQLSKISILSSWLQNVCMSGCQQDVQFQMTFEFWRKTQFCRFCRYKSRLFM